MKQVKLDYGFIYYAKYNFPAAHKYKLNQQHITGTLTLIN